MEKIEELFKKFVYTGVGLASLTKDKLETVINNLIKDEKISAKEGKKIVDDFLKNTDSKKKELETQLKDAVDKTVSKFNFAKKNDLENLIKRVEKLEKSIKN